MVDLEKVMNGLKCCAEDVNEFNDCLSNDCPYKHKQSCCSDMARDALELLKSYQPRVLTLEEATGEDECWFETKYVKFCGYADCIMMFDGTVHLWRCFASKPTILDGATYGREWRCWSARPTDEERKAVAWK